MKGTPMRDQIVPIAVGRKRPVSRQGNRKSPPRENTKSGQASGTVLLESLTGAFEELGGQAYLVALARDDPKTFLALLGKILPYQAKGFGTGAMEITITIGGHED